MTRVTRTKCIGERHASAMLQKCMPKFIAETSIFVDRIVKLVLALVTKSKYIGETEKFSHELFFVLN